MSLALIPFPMTRTETRYVGMPSWHYDETMQDNHQEVMAAIRRLADGISVTVVAAELLPACRIAESKLSGPIADYERAHERWSKRTRRIQAWQEARIARAETKRREARIAELAALYVGWRFWLSPDSEAAQQWARSKEDEEFWRRRRENRRRLDSLWERSKYSSTSPRMPDGYHDLPVIRELITAASLSPNAVLSVPVGAIKKVQRWAATDPTEPPK